MNKLEKLAELLPDAYLEYSKHPTGRRMVKLVMVCSLGLPDNEMYGLLSQAVDEVNETIEKESNDRKTF